MCHSLFTHLSTEAQLGSFRVWHLRIKLLQTSASRFLCGHKCLIHFEKYQGACLLDHMGKNMFSFVRSCPIIFQSDCFILHFHPQCGRVPVAPHALQHLLLSVFWIFAILIGVQWYLIVGRFLFNMSLVS